jgi:AcrR family transcriptional regulator
MTRSNSKPDSQKTAASRDSLLSAARTVFETSGYSSARVSDIVALAGLSHGSFYSYYTNKEMIFRALADQVVRQIGAASASSYRGADPRQRVASSNRNYLGAFRENARMMAVVEEVATVNPEFAVFRRQLWAETVDRVRKSMERDRSDGWVDETLDLGMVSYALVGMVERFAFTWFVLGVPFDWDAAVSHLTGMWLRAGGYRVGEDGTVSRW